MVVREPVHFECGVSAIPLTQGRYALIDTADWPIVAGRNWFFDARAKRGTGYVRSGTKTYLHREILGLSGLREPDVDHINTDGLDNRRANLRTCTRSQNMANRRNLGAPGTSSRYLGVSWHKKARKWSASYTLKAKSVYVGLFDSEADAARARDAAAREAFGGFATQNFGEEPW